MILSIKEFHNVMNPDSLIQPLCSYQDQVTRAEEQESLFLVRQDLELRICERNEMSERLLISETKCENLQQELGEKTSKVIRTDNRKSKT